MLTTCWLSWAAAPSAVAAGDPAPPPFVFGADVSALPVFEGHGAVYLDAAGTPGDALQILHGAGMNCFRLRLFVNPDGEGIVTNDLAYTLALAKRVKATGAQLLLDLHYSDTWADPSKQFKPAAWADLPFDALVERVRTYTQGVFARFIQEGVAPDYVQLGNEITNGMLWPDGKVEFATGADDTAAWDRLGKLLTAANAGLEAAFMGHPLPQRILHIESTGNIARTQWYLKNADARHVPYDIVGLSYYPEWHGSLDDLKATMAAIVDQVCKPVMVVELAYPWKPGGKPDGARGGFEYPQTPEGQREFLTAVGDAVRAVPWHLGRGVVWWHPESVLTPGLNVWLGGSRALWDDHGRLLRAASAIQGR